MTLFIHNGTNQTVNDTFFSQNTDRRQTYENAICGIALTIIMVAGILGNLAVIISVLRFRNLRDEVANMFTVNLSITDMCTSIIVMLSSLVIFIVDDWPLGSFWCNLVCAANYCLIIVSMLTLCFISIDRYIAIKHPLHYTLQITRKRVLIMILYSWFQGIVFAILPVIFEWVEFDYWEVICAISWYKERQQALFYVIFAFLLCFLVPGLILIYNYCYVFNIAHRHCRQINQTVQTLKTNSNANSNVYSTSSKAIKSLLIVVIFYFLCMAPFSCTKLYKVSVDEKQSLPNYLNLVSSLMAFISSAVNPLIYGLFRQDFRRAYKLLWRRISARNLVKNTVEINYIHNDKYTVTALNWSLDNFSSNSKEPQVHGHGIRFFE